MELMKMALSEPVIKTCPACWIVSKKEKGSYVETIGRLIGVALWCGFRSG